ncbi:hypothetical protein BDZ89DRAFT_1068031 [Hymenopellis radicata]|nr:hypothetical protein BDZ89DRAFT_1068031 [Hymenopellis radicata]
MHPIHDAPDDVLREIFLYTKLDWGEDIYEWGPPELLDRVRIPWKISQVSRNWRAVATHIPQLWSIIVLDFTRCEEGSEDIWSEYLRRSLEWSRSSLLSVVLCSSRDVLASSTSRALFASAHRWQCLIVDIPLAMHHALASNAPSFDVLADLTIRNTARERPLPNEGSGGLLKHAPKLDLLEIDADLLCSNILPLQQITALHTFGAQNMDTLSRLMAFSQLDDLILTFGTGSYPYFYRNLYLPAVTALAIYQDADCPVHSIEQVYGIMVLPNLNELSLYFDRSLQLPSYLARIRGFDGVPNFDHWRRRHDHEAMFEMVLSRIERAVPFQSLRLNTPLVLENAAKAAQWEEICASKVEFVHITKGFYD